MYLAMNNIIPPKEWEHNPIITDSLGDTVAMKFAKNNIIESVSGTFGLEDFYNGATLFCGNYELFDIDKKTYIPYEFTFEQFANYYKEKSELSIKDKQKLLTKIMVPGGFLN